MSADFVVLSCNYGRLEKDKPYRVVERGYDYVKVSVANKLIFVPKSLIVPNWVIERQKRNEEESQEYDEFV